MDVKEMRELDHRGGDGVEVRLLWCEEDGELKVVVESADGESFEVAARPDNALDVFQHPFAYRRSG